MSPAFYLVPLILSGAPQSTPDGDAFEDRYYAELRVFEGKPHRPRDAGAVPRESWSIYLLRGKPMTPFSRTVIWANDADGIPSRYLSWGTTAETRVVPAEKDVVWIDVTVRHRPYPRLRMQEDERVARYSDPVRLGAPFTFDSGDAVWVEAVVEACTN